MEEHREHMSRTCWNRLGRLALAGVVAVVLGATVSVAEILDGVAAIVNDKVITYSEVRDYVQPVVRELSRDYDGKELLAKVHAAQQDALNNLIERNLILQEFKEKGFSIPSSVVDEDLNSHVADEFGGNRAAFIKTLEAQHMTLAQYRDQLRDRIIVQAMRNRKTQNEVVVSPYKIEKYYQEHLDDYKVGDEIKLRMIYIKKVEPEPAPEPAAAPASTAEVENATSEGTTNGTVQPTAATTNSPAEASQPVPATNEPVSAAVSSTNQVAPSNDIATADSLVSTNEAVSTNQVAQTNAVVSTPPPPPPVDPHRTLGEEIVSKLDSGASFDSMARVYSEGKEGKEGGDWGWIGHDVLRKELGDIAFTLKPGQHSKLIETDEGYYILQVDDVKPTHEKPLPEVRDEIERILLEQQRAKMQADWVKDLRAKAYIRMF